MKKALNMDGWTLQQTTNGQWCYTNQDQSKSIPIAAHQVPVILQNEANLQANTDDTEPAERSAE